VHIILFINYSFFEIFGIKTKENSSNTKTVIEWTKEVRKRDQNQGFNLYVNKFMITCYIMLHGNQPPRMFCEFKNILQLRKNTKIRDWYLDEDHTIIRVYSFE
jgi:hypothetical protein